MPASDDKSPGQQPEPKPPPERPKPFETENLEKGAPPARPRPKRFETEDIARAPLPEEGWKSRDD